MFATLFDANLTTHQPDGGVCLPTGGECDLRGMVMLDLPLSVPLLVFAHSTDSGELQLSKYVVSLEEFIFLPKHNFVDDSWFDLKLAHSIISSIYKSTQHKKSRKTFFNRPQVLTSECSLFGIPFSASIALVLFSTRRRSTQGFKTARTPIATSMGAASNPIT